MSSTKKMTPALQQPGVTEEVQTTECSNPTPLPAKDPDAHPAKDPDALIAAFAAKWPACFFIDEDKRRPLKLKIHFDIRPAFDYDDRDAIRDALRRYVSCDSYLHGLKVEAERIGLHGKPAGEVTREEAEAARNRLKYRADYEAELELRRQRLHAANADKPRLSLGRRS